MKKYIIMASVAALAIGLSSCSNFLDELPDNRTELNENNVGKILLSAYPTTAICGILLYGNLCLQRGFESD